MVARSSIPAWKIPWTEEPGRLQSMGSQSRTRLRDVTEFTVFNFVENLKTHTHTISSHYYFIKEGIFSSSPN